MDRTDEDRRHWTHWWQAPRWWSRMLRVNGLCRCAQCDLYRGRA